jgi:hypothetical protein
MTESTSTTADGQTAERAERFQRKRGAGFPVVALPEAVSILRKAGKHGNEHAITAFAGYLGHSTSNSGSFKRRLAAFRDWKFIAGATGERVVFTELGRRIAFPTDPTKEKRDLQEAFQNCALFWKVYDDSAKGLPISLATLANHGVQLGVAPVSKQQFAESLTESAVEAGFAEMEGDKIVFVGPSTLSGVVHEREINDSIRVTDQVRAVAARAADAFDSAEPVHVTVESGGSVVGGGHHSLSVERQEPVGDRPALLHQQSWEIDGGSLTLEIRSNHSLPAEAFIQIGKVMVEVEKLKEFLVDRSDSGEPEE